MCVIGECDLVNLSAIFVKFFGCQILIFPPEASPKRGNYSKYSHAKFFLSAL